MEDTTKQRRLVEAIEGVPCKELFGNAGKCAGTCCFTCKHLDKCIRKWKAGIIYCPLVNRSRWCSATKKRYEEIFGNGTVEK